MLSSVFRIHSRNVDLSRENWIFFRFEDPHQNEVDPKPWFSFWLLKNNCLTDRLMISRWVPGLGQGAAGSHGAHWRPPRPQRLRLTRGARFSRAWQVYGDLGTFYSGPLIERIWQSIMHWIYIFIHVLRQGVGGYHLKKDLKKSLKMCNLNL